MAVARLGRGLGDADRLAAAGAGRSDPIFPAGSRLGLVPPAGMVASHTFDGFNDPTKDAAILITVLPAAAYAQLDKTLDRDAQETGRRGRETRADAARFGKGFLLIGRQTVEKVRYRKWLLVAGRTI